MDLLIMREEEDYKNISQNTSIHPFLLHYHCNDQIHVFISYCKNIFYSTLILSTTESVVK